MGKFIFIAKHNLFEKNKFLFSFFGRTMNYIETLCVELNKHITIEDDNEHVFLKNDKKRRLEFYGEIRPISEWMFYKEKGYHCTGLHSLPTCDNESCICVSHFDWVHDGKDMDTMSDDDKKSWKSHILNRCTKNSNGCLVYKGKPEDNFSNSVFFGGEWTNVKNAILILESGHFPEGKIAKAKGKCSSLCCNITHLKWTDSVYTLIQNDNNLKKLQTKLYDYICTTDDGHVLKKDPNAKDFCIFGFIKNITEWFWIAQGKNVPECWQTKSLCNKDKCLLHTVIVTSENDFYKISDECRKNWLDHFKSQCIINENECWLYSGYQNADGYCHANFMDKNPRIHRLTYQLHQGEFIESEKIQVRHGTLCKRNCCNFEHFLLGDGFNQAQDKRIKGTLPIGETNPNTDLTDKKVIKIFASKGNGTQAARAVRLGTSVGVIKGIDGGYSWTHLTKLPKKEQGPKKIYLIEDFTDEDFENAQIYLRDNSTPMDNLNFLQEERDSSIFCECRKWNLGMSSTDYGQATFKNNNIESHRLALVVQLKRRVRQDYQASHICGNSWCCEISHLVEETRSENMARKRKHGTMQEGEDSALSILSQDQVDDIRFMARSGIDKQIIYAKYTQVLHQTIEDVINGRTWKKSFIQQDETTTAEHDDDI